MLQALDRLRLEHDAPLAVLAAVVCLLACTAAISLFHRARVARGVARAAWVAAAGIVAGGGLWATHVIALLAFTSGPISEGYGLHVSGIALIVLIALNT